MGKESVKSKDKKMDYQIISLLFGSGILLTGGKYIVKRMSKTEAKTEKETEAKTETKTETKTEEASSVEAASSEEESSSAAE